MRRQGLPIVEPTSERTASDWHVELTLRDVFAMAALSGLAARPFGKGIDADRAAELAWAFADALMARRMFGRGGGG